MTSIHTNKFAGFWVWTGTPDLCAGPKQRTPPVILSVKVQTFLSTPFPFLQNDFVVETSLVGTVFNGLSHLDAVGERGQFVVGLLRGLGGNLNLKTRQEFAREVSSRF